MNHFSPFSKSPKPTVSKGDPILNCRVLILHWIASPRSVAYLIVNCEEILPCLFLLRSSEGLSQMLDSYAESWSAGPAPDWNVCSRGPKRFLWFQAASAYRSPLLLVSLPVSNPSLRMLGPPFGHLPLASLFITRQPPSGCPLDESAMLRLNSDLQKPTPPLRRHYSFPGQRPHQESALAIYVKGLILKIMIKIITRIA